MWGCDFILWKVLEILFSWKAGLKSHESTTYLHGDLKFVVVSEVKGTGTLSCWGTPMCFRDWIP